MACGCVIERAGGRQRARQGACMCGARTEMNDCPVRLAWKVPSMVERKKVSVLGGGSSGTVSSWEEKNPASEALVGVERCSTTSLRRRRAEEAGERAVAKEACGTPTVSRAGISPPHPFPPRGTHSCVPLMTVMLEPPTAAAPALRSSWVKSVGWAGRGHEWTLGVAPRTRVERAAHTRHSLPKGVSSLKSSVSLSTTGRLVLEK